jgi:hypothetical protein
MPTERAKLFGDDLRLALYAGGLDLAPDNAGDLDLTHGNDNIVQALTLRLMVRRGELAPLGWPTYGSRIHELIGELNNARTHIKLMAFARAALEQDARVREITDIRTLVLPGERDVVRLQIEILLIDRPNPLNLVYDVNLEAT